MGCVTKISDQGCSPDPRKSGGGSHHFHCPEGVEYDVGGCWDNKRKHKNYELVYSWAGKGGYDHLFCDVTDPVDDEQKKGKWSKSGGTYVCTNPYRLPGPDPPPTDSPAPAPSPASAPTPSPDAPPPPPSDPTWILPVVLMVSVSIIAVVVFFLFAKRQAKRAEL